VNAKRLDGPPGKQDLAARVFHLTALRSAFEELRTERRSLISQFQEHLQAISSYRRDMREIWDRWPTPPQAEPRALRLQGEYGLTPREAEVAVLLAEGLSNSALARRLGISPHTARHHTQRVLGKLGVHSRAEAGARLRR